MSTRHLIVSLYFILLIILPQILAITMYAKDNSPGDIINIEIDEKTLKDSFLTREWLTSVSINLLKQNFAEDIKRRHRVNGILCLREVTNTGVLFELISLFLYREAYTAVNHRIVFSISGKDVTIQTSE